MYLGIDLGTSNSAIADYIDGKIRIFKSAEIGTDVLPSAIYIDQRGNKFYGHRAYKYLFTNQKNAVDGFKRQMGTSWNKEFAGSDIVMNAEECSAEILKQLLEQAHMVSGQSDITGAVITTPAAFNQIQIEATHRAAKLAGLERVMLLQEPVAAAMAAVAESQNKDGLFLVYDIGGGTFDLALAQSVRGSINILAHEGINALGGRDFDRMIVNSLVRPWLLDNYSLPQDFQKIPRYKKMILVARMAAEAAKIELSKRSEATVYLAEDDLRVTDNNRNKIFIDMPITRDQFNELIADKINETISMSHKILKKNGYQPKDLDRLVFVGGPSNIPFLRENVSHELQVPADVSVDPMVVVAMGAAIFCEGVDWSKSQTARKPSRKSHEVDGDVALRYDYTARTADDHARIRIKPKEGHSKLEVQIDSNEGWTSGRCAINDIVSIELLLSKIGKNHFNVLVFNQKGEPINSMGQKILIVRTAASAGALRLTHHLAAVVVSGDDDNKKNILHIFAEKGINLPDKGVMPSYHAARDLHEGDAPIHVNFFEIPESTNLTPGEPNLFIGSCEIPRDKITSDINAGDEVKIHWEVDESQVIRLGLELSKSGEVLGGEFYSSQMGELNYDGKDGERLVSNMQNEAEKEVVRASKISAPGDAPTIRKLRNSLNEQKETLKIASDGEERRGIAEKIRDIRQKIAAICFSPQNRVANLHSKFEETVENFDSSCRNSTPSDICEKFDSRAKKAKSALSQGEIGCDDAEKHLKSMKRIHNIQRWKQPNYIINGFRYFTRNPHLAIDKQKHMRLVKEGKKALDESNIDRLREILGEMVDNNIEREADVQSIFADIQRV